MPGGKAAWTQYRHLLHSGAGIRETMMVRQNRTFRVVFKPRSRGRPCSGRTPQTIILLTDLIDPAITAGSLLAAFERRWAVETVFRELKVSITTVERWHSRSTDRLRLEIQAILIWFLIAALVELARQDYAMQQGFIPDGRVVERVGLLRRTGFLVFDLIANGTCDLKAAFDGLGNMGIPLTQNAHLCWG